MFFAKILIEHTPKSRLKKHPPTKNDSLVVLCNDYRSTSKYQVKRKEYEQLFVSPTYSLYLTLFLQKNYTALLTESFRMSMTYFKTRSRQITNH